MIKNESLPTTLLSWCLGLKGFTSLDKFSREWSRLEGTLDEACQSVTYFISKNLINYPCLPTAYA